MRAILMFQYEVMDKVTRQCPETTAFFVLFLMASLNGKPVLTILPNSCCWKKCVCSQASDTCVTVKLVICTFLHARIMSRINYISNVWDSCSDMHIKKLKFVHKRAVKVLCAPSPVLAGRGYNSHGSLPLKEHLWCNKRILLHKVIHNKSHPIREKLVQTGAHRDHSSRNSIGRLKSH